MKFYNKLYSAAATALFGLLAAGCSDVDVVTNPPVVDEPIVIERGTFAKGADVSWVTELEAAGCEFMNAAGEKKELMQLLKEDCGVNAIRLRVWVNPENSDVVKGWCNIDDAIIKARRAHNLGLRLMIDFHFSDTWADPGNQTIPAAWANMTIDEVKVAMTDHVNEMMSKLKAYGIEPEWVQIGNETRGGMMWPLGELDNGDNFTQMVNAGYDAVKSYFPEAQVIVHIDSGDNLWIYERIFDKLAAEGGKYDMIGMSLYPAIDTWEKNVSDCIGNMETVQTKYGKPVMMCEIGIDHDQAEIADLMMRKMVEDGKAVDLKGIFWWEPESPSSRYGKGCFDEYGRPTAALDVFTEI